MLLGRIIAAMLGVSVLYALIAGNTDSLSAAMISGASDAVSLAVSICGMVCLWSAVMEVMSQSGLAEKLSRLLRPVLGRLFPGAAGDSETMEALSANVSANLLGLGNAATPAGIRAAKGLRRLGGGDRASNELCLLVVMNTASIQLIPATVAALRASLGAQTPFDVLPAVWCASLVSVCAGIVAARLLERRT